MSSNRSLLARLAVPVLLVAVSAACGSSASSTPTPTSTAPSRTASRTPTRASSPSAEPASGVPGALADALARARNVNSVRFEITSRVTYTVNDAPVQEPGLSARGEQSGSDRHLAMTGPTGTGDALAFEFITLGGVTYVKGLTGLPGVNRDQWYIFSSELGDVTRDAPDYATLLAALASTDLAQGNFSENGTRELDGQSCTLWRAGNPELAARFSGMANSPEATAQLKAVDRAEFHIATCPDGHVHEVASTLEGHDPTAPSHKATATWLFHIYDQDKPIQLAAPANARPFQAPASATLAPTTNP